MKEEGGRRKEEGGRMGCGFLWTFGFKCLFWIRCLIYKAADCD